MSRRRLVLLVLLLLVVTGSWLLREPDLLPGPAPTGSDDQPDYFLRGMESITTGTDGRLQHRLIAHSMIHYPAGDTTELSQPFIEIHQQDGSHWTVQARQGRYSDEQREMWLHGEVRLRQYAPEADLRLETESLRLLPDTRFAETADPVLLLSPGTRLQGIGMELYGDEQRLILLSGVQGIHYETPP